MSLTLFVPSAPFCGGKNQWGGKALHFLSLFTTLILPHWSQSGVAAALPLRSGDGEEAEKKEAAADCDS